MRIETNRVTGQATEAQYPGSIKDGVGEVSKGSHCRVEHMRLYLLMSPVEYYIPSSGWDKVAQLLGLDKKPLACTIMMAAMIPIRGVKCCPPLALSLLY